MMGNVIVGGARQSGRAARTTGSAVGIHGGNIESPHECAPGDSGRMQEIADVGPAHLNLIARGIEHMSPIGSGSPITVSDPLPPSTSSPVPLSVLTAPLVCPEIRLIAPGVEG